MNAVDKSECIFCNEIDTLMSKKKKKKKNVVDVET